MHIAQFWAEGWMISPSLLFFRV